MMHLLLKDDVLLAIALAPPRINFVSSFYQKAFALTNVRVKIYKKEIKPIKVLSPEISILLFFEFAIKIRIVKI